MPIAYTVLPQGRLILTLWYGRVTLPEWKAHLAGLLADPQFDGSPLHLVDVRSADVEATIGPAEIEEIVAFLQPSRSRLNGRKVAVLAGKEMPRSNLTANVVSSLGLTVATFVFTGTALEWLELSPEIVEPRLQEMRRQLPQT